MDIIISNSSEAPIYRQISEQIKEEILKGGLKENDALPSIRNLARDLRVSVITTKKAYEELEKDGFINSVAGKGCFVAKQGSGMIKEAGLRQVEEQLSKAVDTAVIYGITEDEVLEILRLLYDN
ncbi:MAG TPA: GntR family transcriptional regulator [Firmicutes bacterium]|nr:GntR family transcriptional regulator [Bacillota bacterium]